MKWFCNGLGGGRGTVQNWCPIKGKNHCHTFREKNLYCFLKRWGGGRGTLKTFCHKKGKNHYRNFKGDL